MIRKYQTTELIIVCLPTKLPIDVFDGIVSKCRFGFLKEIEKWSIEAIEEYVGKHSLFRFPNEFNQWVCANHGGIASGRIPSNLIYEVLQIYRDFGSLELEFVDLRAAIERYFSELKKLTVKPFLQPFSWEPTLGGLERFTSLIAQEVWDEFRSSKEPRLDPLYFLYDEKKVIEEEWREKKRIWELNFPKVVPDSFIDQVRDMWRSETILESGDQAVDSWMI